MSLSTSDLSSTLRLRSMHSLPLFIAMPEAQATAMRWAHPTGLYRAAMALLLPAMPKKAVH